MIRLLRALCVFLLLLTLVKPGSCRTAPTRVRDVVYGRMFGMALTMDVLKPAKPSGIGVVFMVSGGWVSNIDAAGNGEMLQPFLQRGQTVFLVCHSSRPRFTLDEIVPEIHRSVRFIRTHAAEYGVNPNRLGIAGLSSGGHLSTTIGTMGGPGDPAAKDPVDRASSRVEAVACFFPPVDFVDYGQKGRAFIDYPLAQSFCSVFGFKTQSRDEQLKALRGYSPYYFISPETPPTLIVQGDADPLVPDEQAKRFMARLAEMKVPHELVMRHGVGHGWPGIDKDFGVLAAWFDKYLTGSR